MAKTNKDTAEAFGLTDAEAGKTRDIVPTYNLGTLKVGESVKFQISDSLPRKVKFLDKDTEEEKEQLVLNVVDQTTGTEQAIWLSSKSLRMEFYKLHQKYQDLKGVNIVIAVREYKHEKYGNTRAYTVQVDKSASLFNLEDE